ncbi:zinc transporter 2 [Trichonephila clavata]|uniref:Zinc transporter 2 n=1 Tax=Trichonephila clavata TaxID=2740835 RepID=A0A8X6KYF3_TRICU|nr:zinc transporter 2 [Trichonephila clavata]
MTTVYQTTSEDVQQMLSSHRSYISDIYGNKPNWVSSGEEIRKADKVRLLVASVLCLIFMLAEFVGGILSNSLALITDAAHMLTDFGAFLVSLTSLFIAGRKRTQTMTFGFHRAEVIGALISILSIWLLTGILLYAAVQRIISLDFDIDASIMVILAIIAMITNIVLGCILLFPGSSNKTEKKSLLRKHGMGLRSAFIHVLGDVAHGAGLLVASLVIYFVPEYKIADPICTVVFSVIVLITTLSILKDIILVLMEGVPKHISFYEVHNVLFSLPEISKVHDLRMWSLTMGKVALSAHIVIKSGENPTEVLKKATSIIYENIDVYEVTLQIEEEQAVSDVQN